MGSLQHKIQDKTFVVKPFSLKNPYNFPKSYGHAPKVFTIPNKDNNILVMGDIHVPYHDHVALKTALDYGKEHKINTIFFNGDLIDFYQISRFDTLERRRSVKQELEATREFLAVLNKEFPGAPIYFLMGNHDKRLEIYLATKAPEVLDMLEFKLKDLLEADKYNMTVIEDTTLVKMGKLAVTHGHLLLRGIFAPVNAARGAFLRSKASVLISHVHKVSTHSEANIHGKVITTYSTGCLCELNPTYAPYANNYSHGFAHVKVKPNGNYSVRNIQIINGEIVN